MACPIDDGFALICAAHQICKPRYPDAHFYLDVKGASTQPLTVAEALARFSALTIPRPNSPDSESELGGVYRSVLAEWREEINTWSSLLHTKIVAKRRQQLLYSRTAQSGELPFQPRPLELSGGLVATP